MFRNLASKVILPVLAVGHHLALASGPYAYVSNISGNNVSVVEVSSGSMVASIGVPAGPNGIAVTPDGSAVYVVSETSNNVSIISTNTNSVVATVAVGTTP